ncbi:MAG: nucleotide sugar dehydrogenase [Candidatus Diapherotrites archaeon]|nr:nucleotide sugar dehydrogenase [Candidatus Diapherotrites archaeon]
MAKQTVAIIGLGYVGLPLACLCARRNFKVYGFDIDEAIVKATNSGKSHIADASLVKNVKALKGKIIATTDAQKAISNADVVVVCVPTPIDENKLPDLKPLESACRSIAQHLHKGQLIIIESTIYPGTVREIVKPILEKSGLISEKDFYLAHCPERIDPGNKKWVLESIPRVLGGLGGKGTKIAEKFYNSILKSEILVLSSIECAEAVKVVENTFRDVNIAFVNELAKSFDRLGIDVLEVIKGASTKPFGYMPFYPGPGVGGHCISVDPYYLIERAKQKGFEHEFLMLARKINDSMAGHVVLLAESALQKSDKTLQNSNIALLGLAYKANVDDMRESPALHILQLLKSKGASPKIFDPHIMEKSNCASIDAAIKNADCIILATHHKEFVSALTAQKLKSMGVKAVIDARNCLDKSAITAKGIIYKGIGH